MFTAEFISDHLRRTSESLNNKLPLSAFDSNGFDITCMPLTDTASAVLLLIGDCNGEPCIVLNKRSDAVRQPGDLCCPGGGIHPRLDALFAKLLTFPFMPLAQWPHWRSWQKHPSAACCLSILLATGLREGFEEMRLNPFGTTFLGPLPPQRLVLFQRTIYPLVARIKKQKHFFPNWEVEKLVYIPLRTLCDAGRYRRLVLKMADYPDMPSTADSLGKTKPLACFLHATNAGTEYLWGATYRIVMTFLEIAFNFKPPPTATLPEFPVVLGKGYLTAGVNDAS